MAIIVYVCYRYETIILKTTLEIRFSPFTEGEFQKLVLSARKNKTYYSQI